MRENLHRLLDDLTLTTLALAIGLGWSLYQVGVGLANLITTYFTPVARGHGYPTNLSFYLTEVRLSQGGLAWVVGHRIVTVGKLVSGLVELGLVLLVALFVKHRAFRSGTLS